MGTGVVKTTRISLRFFLGGGGEVFVTGKHARLH
jgi:hypothetical protein